MDDSVVEWFANRIKTGALITMRDFNELVDEAKLKEEKKMEDWFLLGVLDANEGRGFRHYYKKKKVISISKAKDFVRNKVMEKLSFDKNKKK